MDLADPQPSPRQSRRLMGEPRCLTCVDPNRDEIDQGVLRGLSYRVILEGLPDGSSLTPRNLGDHFRAGHLRNVEQGAARKMTLRATPDDVGLGLSVDLVDGAAEAVADRLGFLGAIVGRVSERLVRGEIQPDVRDALAALKLIDGFEQRTGTGWDPNRASRVATAMFHAAQAVLSPSDLKAWANRFQQDPAIRELISHEETDRRRRG